MTSSHNQKLADRRELFWAVWAVSAAFATYFCMYGFRKPYTSASFSGVEAWGLDYKTVIVSTQVIGYMISKFIGIKVIAEMPPQRRAVTILLLIGIAELGLVAFGALPMPWNAAGLFANGLVLGMVFGLVLSFLEGRRLTEALVAGLCASFILADGVTKSVGAWILNQGVPDVWMPSAAGLVFLVPLCVAVAMLSRVPPPNEADVAARTERHTMTRTERWAFFRSYGLGLSLLVFMYLLVTVMRSIRADFAPELWRELGAGATPDIFTRSELWVAFGVLAVNGSAFLVRSNRVAFGVSLATCFAGFLLVGAAIVGQRAGTLGAFPFMVLIGLGLYLPYVAVHTTVFERLLAMTHERANLGFLMYIADAFGYLGYVVIMFAGDFSMDEGSFLKFFIASCTVCASLSAVSLFLSWRYFATRQFETLTPAEDLT